ncbi:hypothetical protein M2284_002800 [Rhodococcus sp. LBL1]|uniref:Uncharacterized protein n=1 Tax=Prescottella agglutinans TaxID=1644129 RepID=A0ABT6MK72_9NOCA|nr:hypothetical protein [Prescottella agglutinans]MDH6284718.1 hypothetical protein [Prescottella agglutinans]MDH6678587.1 hypothetical protein [Rhodococcus sp. LBL1]MDH6684535.1 hypothetical protein [Rhodococcus sp. LBL2]
MARHAAKQNRWARRAVVAGALPLAIAAASTGTAQAQDTGSANIPGLPNMPEIQAPPLWNPIDLNKHPLNFLRPGYAPTPEQRIADFTDAGQLFGGVAGLEAGALGSAVVGGAAVALGAIALGIIGPAAAVPVGTALGAVTIAGGLAGGSVGAELGGQAGANLARMQNAPAAPLS